MPRHCATTRAPGNALAPFRGRAKSGLRLLWLAAVSSLLFDAENSSAQQPKPNEYQVKAAYIYNFAKFVSWPAKSPAASNNEFDICVFEKDPFGTVLESTLAGKSLDGKPVVIKRLPGPQATPGCRILFINSAQDHNLREILTAAKDASVLTISDLPDFSKRGGMIQFVLTDNRVRFEINVTSAENAGLVLGSDLLKVAITVRRSTQPGG